MDSVAMAEASIAAKTAVRPVLVMAGERSRYGSARLTSGITTTNIMTMNASVRTTVRTASDVRACAALTTSASRHHAVTSSTAAQVSAIAPIGVRLIFRSVRIRARTGN